MVAQHRVENNQLSTDQMVKDDDEEEATDEFWAQCERCNIWRAVSRHYGKAEHFFCEYEPPATCGDGKGVLDEETRPLTHQTGEDHYEDDEADLVNNHDDETPTTATASSESTPSTTASSNAQTGNRKRDRNDEALPALTTKEDIRRQRKLRKKMLKKLKAQKEAEMFSKPSVEGLVTACQSGKVDLVRRLLDLKTNVNGEFEGTKPLSTAVESGNVAVVKLLLSRRADLNTDVSDGNMLALHHASESGSFDMVRAITASKSVNLDILNATGYTPLHVALPYQNIVQHLVDHRANIDAISRDDGSTALLIAAKSGLLKSVKVLLAAKASVNVPDNEGVTPLWVAAFAQNLDLVTALLRNDSIKVNAKSANWDTPLWSAVLTAPQTKTTKPPPVTKDNYQARHCDQMLGKTVFSFWLTDILLHEHSGHTSIDQSKSQTERPHEVEKWWPCAPPSCHTTREYCTDQRFAAGKGLF